MIVIKYILAFVAAAFLYSSGYNAAKNKYLERGLEEQSQLVKRYEVHIEKLKHRQLQIEFEAEQYRIAARDVGVDAKRLRAKLATMRTPTCVVAQPKSSDESDGRRIETLGNVLGFATTLIEERDRIALQYNELRKSCDVR